MLQLSNGPQMENPGDALRDMAAKLLSARYGGATIEKRVIGKKVDVFFEIESFGKKTRIFVEAKDYEKPLRRSQVSKIWSDYSGIINGNNPALLLIVTRNGLTTDADAYVSDEQNQIRHQTIRQIENDALGLEGYIESQVKVFEEDGLSDYYIPARALKINYSEDQIRNYGPEIDAFNEITEWIDGKTSTPIAILAGYGAGKSSLAKRLMAYQSGRALNDNDSRRPILIRLGGLTRYSSIEGLLGGTFTSEFPTPNFNFQVFVKLNKLGRILIILDGFDEMKHAMSWVDFKNQIRDLNRLIDGDSRVILLGRPTAFLSLEEQLFVLRGVRRFGTQNRHDIDWPQFAEFELCEFNAEEVSLFIKKYLSYKLKRLNVGDSTVGERIEEVQEITSIDTKLFAKPVHLKILVDLAADIKVNLERISGGVTRWALYEMFFAELSDREAAKEARRPLSSNNRLTFLRELAYWLWSSKDGQISFQVEDLPQELFEFSGYDFVSHDVAAREFLTGAFIEKKDGDTYFFGHRSFAEFLVAQYMVCTPPRGAAYSYYSRLIVDGVAQFIADHDSPQVFDGWVENISSASRMINLEFLSFLQLKVSEEFDLRKRLPQNSALSELYKIYVPDTKQLRSGVAPELDEKFWEKLDQSFRTVPVSILGQLVHFYLQASGRFKQNDDVSIASKFAGVLLERVFKTAELDPNARKSFVEIAYDDDRKLAVECIGPIRERSDGRYLSFFWEPLLDWGHSNRNNRVVVSSRELTDGAAVPIEIRLPWTNILAFIDSEVREKVIEHFRRSPSMSDVVTKQMRSRKAIRKGRDRPRP